MRKLILLCTVLCAMALLTSASPVRAQQALWVANNGSDANPCIQTSPCATFQGAINKGSVRQINCLTSGNYGSFTITASIIIDCGAGNVGNVVLSGFGGQVITITTAGPGATVVLRHLSLNGGGNTNEGVYASTFPSGRLIVEDCMMQGFGAGSGIYLGPSGSRSLLQVSNSQFFNNAYGITVAAQTGLIATVMLDQVELTANSYSGLVLQGAGVVAGTMRNSVAGANVGDGVYAEASQVYFTVEELTIVGNLANGVETNSAGSFLKVAASTIGGNGTGVKATLGSLISFGDNHMSDNGSDGTFTSTKALK